MKIGNKIFTTKSPIMVFLNMISYIINTTTLYLIWVSPNENADIILLMVFISVALSSFALYGMVDVVKDNIKANLLG